MRKIERRMPADLEAEESLIGAMLLSTEAVEEVMEHITAGDFYSKEHQEIVEAIATIWRRGKAVDCVTVGRELKNRGSGKDETETTAYLTELVASTPVISHVDSHIGIVIDLAKKRELITTATKIAEESLISEMPAEVLVDRAEAEIFALGEGRREGGTERIEKSISEALDRLEGRGSAVGLPTGLIDLDRLTGGLREGELIVVGARPSMGKTALAMGIAAHIATEKSLPVLVASLEMGEADLTARLIAGEARLNHRGAELTEVERSRMGIAAKQLAIAPLFINDRPTSTPQSIRSEARRLKAKEGLALIVVDYLQLMTAGGRINDRQAEIAEVSRSLKVLARELEIPIIAVSQLSRKLEDRSEKRPLLSDLRESGQIEQDADLVLFLYRDEVYSAESKDAGVAEVIVAKNRNGATGTTRMAWIAGQTRFANLAR